MILAEVNWLGVSINLLLVIHIVVSLLMVLVILMQRPKQEGLGAAFGSGTTDQLFGARTTNVLQKGTVYLGVIFFILTLVLAILIARRNKIESLVKAAPAAQEQAAEPATQPDKGKEPTPATGKAANEGTEDKAAPGEKPADVTPKPADVTPKPADVTPKPADVTPKPADAEPKPGGAEKPANLKPVPAPVPPPAEPEVGTPPEAPAEPAEPAEPAGNAGDNAKAATGAAVGAALGGITGDAEKSAEGKPSEEKPADGPQPAAP